MISINIIIPSYNESKSIGFVIKGIRKVYPDSRIIVVDDSNINENIKITKIISQFKNIEILTRGKKMGRGSAVIYGFKYGLKYKQAKYFFEMDSDLANDPKHLKRYISKMEEGGIGLVIGSRYMKGGKIVNVSLLRRILSKLINAYLHFMLGIKLTDYTDGFRCYNRSAVEFLVNANIKSTGFITLSETIYKLNRNGFKIDEVPVTIFKRKHGQSTVDIRELAISFLFIIRMKIEEELLGKFK